MRLEDQRLFLSLRAAREEPRIAFWRIASKVCPAAFEDLAARPVPSEVVENWEEYCNGGFAVAPRTDFEAQLAAWAKRYHVEKGWILALARESRLAWEVGLCKPPHVDPLLLATGWEKLAVSKLTVESFLQQLQQCRRGVFPRRARPAGRVSAKARRNLERDLRWTVRAVMLNESWEAIARRRSPRSSADVVHKAVKRLAADLGLQVPRKRPGRPKRPRRPKRRPRA